MRRASQLALAAQSEAEAARQAAQVEAIQLAARTLADRLNNDLTASAVVLRLVQKHAALPEDLRQLLPQAVTSLDRGCQTVNQLYNVTHIATQDTPVGLALDLERSAAPNVP